MSSSVINLDRIRNKQKGMNLVVSNFKLHLTYRPASPNEIMPLHPIGPCCLGTKFRHSNGELRPSHKCAICKQIVHMLCAVTKPNSDAWTCKERHDDSRTETYNGSVTGSEKNKSVIDNMTVTVDNVMNDSRTETYHGSVTGSEKEKSFIKI